MTIKERWSDGTSAAVLASGASQCIMESNSITSDINSTDEFDCFSDANLLIDFDDLFMSMEDGDVLQDLEMDLELFTEFTVSSGGNDSSAKNTSTGLVEKVEDFSRIKYEEENLHGSCSSSSTTTKGGEIMSERDESYVVNNPVVTKKKEAYKGKKSSSFQSKNHNNQGKQKVKNRVCEKVNWTAKLHRRFVQAVEQLGVDKAVPSRILELMGIDCLTRRNIASHLQKYRSHRKHLLAREADGKRWTPERQMYYSAAVANGGGVRKRSMSPWIAPPTMVLCPMIPVTPSYAPHFRPLHVWGYPHPTADQSMMHMMWPQHSHSPPPLQTPPHDPSHWHHHQLRFFVPPVPGISPPHVMYKVEPGIGVLKGKSTPQPPLELHPSKESIDAAIGDVLLKPSLPLPLGLKPPSTDSVVVELQLQGFRKLPPTCTA